MSTRRMIVSSLFSHGEFFIFPDLGIILLADQLFFKPYEQAHRLNHLVVQKFETRTTQQSVGKDLEY